jgi:hypothetical protein
MDSTERSLPIDRTERWEAIDAYDMARS